MNINFRKIVTELSDESFEQLKVYLQPYAWNYFVKNDEVTKLMELEKIGEYLKSFETVTKFRDGELAAKYAGMLIQYVDNRILPSKRGETANKAEKYFRRAKQLQASIPECEDSNRLVTILEDFTKVFLCLYDECIKDVEKQITNISFHVSGIDFDKLIEFYRKDVPAQSKLEQKAPDQLKRVIGTKFLRGADEVKKGFGDMQKGFQDAQKEFGDQIKKMVKKTDQTIEPVHDFLEYLDDRNIYTEKDFTIILLTIFYLRIKDYELGMD